MRLYCQDRAQDPPLWTLFPDNIKSFSLSEALSKSLSHTHSLNLSLSLSLALRAGPARGRRRRRSRRVLLTAYNKQWGPALLGRLRRISGLCHYDALSLCCFVLLEPTWMLYRVPRVSPGVTAPILRSLPSRATPGPPLPYRPLQNAGYYYPGLTVGSSICLVS